MRPRFASDPRDKVYALLGLHSNIPNQAAPIIPQYDVDLNELYSQIVSYNIASTKNLEVLGHAMESNLEHQLPSWVPDWSCHQVGSLYQNNRLLRYHLFNSCGCHEVSWQIYNGRTLQLRGLKYATIQDVGAVCDAATANHWLPEEALWIRKQQLSPSSPVDYQILNVLLNDCFSTNDEDAADRRATAVDYQVAQNSLAWFGNDQRFQDTSQDIANQTFTSSICQRKFFITSNGSLGLGPPEMQVGDEVWIVYGGLTPLILRPKEDYSFHPPNSEVGQRCHRFVGDSYICGIMDGEAAGGLEENSVNVFLV
jgi:hypothetical protein